MNCRHCKETLDLTFIDLGFAPPSNAYLSERQLAKPEKYYPLKVMTCTHCWLVQTVDYADADELFSDEYAYFSSTSKSWLRHSQEFSQHIIDKLNLNERSLVVEVASNDGYLLKNFIEKGIPCLGIEPTKSTAEAAEKLGIPVIKKFFGTKLAQEISLKNGLADLIVGNNVYAHVPDINDFTSGIKALLSPMGTVTLEFPHLLNLIKYNQFDTIYHEHFSYLSLKVVNNIFARCGLRVFDVESLATHGGSLRIYGCHEDDYRTTQASVKNCLQEEQDFGLQKIETYKNFQNSAEKIKNDILKFLISEKDLGKSTIAYGAAAKGNTILNFAGVKSDLISFVCDAAKAKQNKFLPGSHIPIVSPSHLSSQNPDNIIIFPWNIRGEIIALVKEKYSKNAKFITFIPEINIHN